MAITKVINDAVDLNQASDYSGLRLPVGTTNDVIESFTTDYLVVAGGGGSSGDSPGGAGAGGLRTSYNNSTTTTNTLSFPSGKTAIATYMLDGNATDVSGNYNGTETSITYNTGQYGGAAVFNGSSSFIQTTLALSSTNVTTSFWFKSDVSTSTNQPLFFTSNGGRIDINIAEGTASANGYYNVLQIVAPNATTQWNHLAVVFEGFAGSYSGSYGSAITFTAYINGSAVTSSGSLTPYAQTANGYEGNMRIGRSGGNYYFNGDIDQVRIYDSALSSTDVTNIYTNEVQANSGGGVAAESSLTLEVGTSYNVTVGAGGASATIGGSSIFSTITCTGGGRGGGNNGGYNGGNGAVSYTHLTLPTILRV